MSGGISNIRNHRGNKTARIVLTALLSAVFLSGCGIVGAGSSDSSDETGISGSDVASTGATSSDTTEEAGTNAGDSAADLHYNGEITIWADHVADLTKEQILTFQSQYSGLQDAVFTIESMDEEDAASKVIADIETGADLFIFAQDQTSRLVSAGGLSAVPEEDVDTVRSDNKEESVSAGTVGGTLYGYPLTADNGSLLYYDTEVVTDPSDLDTILSDCEDAGKYFYAEVNSGWYQPMFFFGTGCNLSYETDEQGNFISANIDYASENGLTALKEIVKLSSSSAFRNGSSASDLEDAAAIIDGPWDAALIREMFGDHYACAKLPSFKGDDGKTYQLSGFSGYRFLGVKPQVDADKLAVCHALAAYLSGAEPQVERYQESGWGPSNLEAVQSEKVRTDEALAALQEQMVYDRPQGLYPGDYWTLAASLGDDVITGSLNENSSDEELMNALQTFQDTCLSYAEP